MYLKITTETSIHGRHDFQKWETTPTTIIIETLTGHIIPFSPTIGQTIELMEGNVVIHKLEAQSLTLMSPELLYALYKTETGKEATYLKKDQVLEYAKYTQWLARKKKQKGFEY